MTAFGVGTSASCAKESVAQAAANRTIAAWRTDRACVRSMAESLEFGLAAHVGDCAGHLVCGLDHLGVHLIGALSRNEVGDLGDGIDVGSLDIALLDDPKRSVARNADRRLAGSSCLLEVIAAERQQAGFVDEVRDRQLAERLRRRLAWDRRGYEAGLADGDRGRRLGNENRWAHVIAVHGDKLAIRVGVERAIAGVDRVAIRRRDLEPTPPLNRQIELVARVGQGALNVDAADRRGANPEADLSAFWNGCVAAAV